MRWLFPHLYPHRRWRMPPADPPRLYLTFDDGPHPRITPWVLKQLAQHQAKATFFCIGANVDRYPEIQSALLQAGHTLGHHTQHHRKGWGCPPALYREEVQQGALRSPSVLFRPPYGKMTARQARDVQRMGYQTIMWDVLTRDYQTRLRPEQCWAHTRHRLRNGSIVVLHDSEKAWPRLQKLLPQLLAWAAPQYQFHALPTEEGVLGSAGAPPRQGRDGL